MRCPIVGVVALAIVLLPTPTLTQVDLLAQESGDISDYSKYSNWISPSSSAAVSPGVGSPYTVQDHLDLDSSPSYEESASRHKYRLRRRRRKNKKKNRNKNRDRDRDRDYDDYRYKDVSLGQDYGDYYDRDDGYGAPKAPAYKAPSSGYDAPSSGYDAPSYEAPSYNAAPSDGYGAPSYGGGGGGGDGFNDFLNALAAFLPIGLFLAAIPPNLIVINSTGKRKKRSLTTDEWILDDESVNEVAENEYSYPFLERISEMGYDAFMKDSGCQKQLFCEMAQRGQSDDANKVQKMFNYAVTMSPRLFSDSVGTTDVFEAAKSGDCGVFKCQDLHN